jgi:hypothetical protein
MCLACEQDAIWLAYLESQGLLEPDDPKAVAKFFADFPMEPLPVKPEWDQPTPEAPTKAAPKLPAENQFSCDDPTAE